MCSMSSNWDKSSFAAAMLTDKPKPRRGRTKRAVIPAIAGMFKHLQLPLQKLPRVNSLNRKVLHKRNMLRQNLSSKGSVLVDAELTEEVSSAAAVVTQLAIAPLSLGRWAGREGTPVLFDGFVSETTNISEEGHSEDYIGHADCGIWIYVSILLLRRIGKKTILRLRNLHRILPRLLSEKSVQKSLTLLIPSLHKTPATLTDAKISPTPPSSFADGVKLSSSVDKDVGPGVGEVESAEQRPDTGRIVDDSR